jgi:hypothetical protein
MIRVTIEFNPAPFAVYESSSGGREMRVTLLKGLTSVAGATIVAMCAVASADTSITVNPADNWIGFMNVFETPQHGGGYVFGSSWGTADLTAVFNGQVLTLGPNTINDPSPFWYTPQGGPGSVGNKIMDANMYVERTGSLNGQTVTFSGNTLSNTLVGHTDANGNGWTSVAFIKDFAPDYSSNVSVTIPLTPGPFSISLPTVNDPNRHVQYGFETIGPDVWITDVGPYGNINVVGVPEPTMLGALALGALVAMRRRRA